MMMLYQQQETILPQDSSIRRRLSQQSNKPIVYTFYHEFNAAAGGTGMTTAADQALLQVWVDEWSRAGWNPKILNMEDVRQHPQFQTVDAMLDGLPFKYYDVSKYRDCRDFCVDRIFRIFLTFLLVLFVNSIFALVKEALFPALASNCSSRWRMDGVSHRTFGTKIW